MLTLRRMLIALLMCLPSLAAALPPIFAEPPSVLGPTPMSSRLITRFYLDTEYAAMPQFAPGFYGHAWRLAPGASFRLYPVAFDVEIPFHVSALFGTGPAGGSAAQVALEAIRAGIRVEAVNAWLGRDARMRFGFGVRTWFPTETTSNYEIRNPAGTLLTVVPAPLNPWHVEPALYWVIGVGPFTFATHQGPNVVIYPPTGYVPVYWDSHAVFALVPHWRFEINLDAQVMFGLSDAAQRGPGAGPQVPFWLVPGVGFYLTRTQRLDFAARIGVTNDAYRSNIEQLFWSGPYSFSLRWTIEFPYAPGMPRRR